MKILVFKTTSETIVRVTLAGAEVSCYLTAAIGLHGHGLARRATSKNCRNMFTPESLTYEIRLPGNVFDPSFEGDEQDPSFEGDEQSCHL